jgi:hypothetical protein
VTRGVALADAGAFVEFLANKKALATSDKGFLD